MKDLEEKILRNFKDSIAMSNLEEEFSMKKVFKKQIITLSILVVVLFSGGLLTVNAATDGKVVEDIKETIYNMLKDNTNVKIDSESIEIQDIKKNNEGDVETITYTFDAKE